MSAGIITLVALFGGFGFSHSSKKSILEYGLDFYRPTKDDRQLTHSNVKIFLREREVQSLRLTMKLGLTASSSTGSITQLVGTLEDGTLRSVTYDSPAFGLGPTIETQLQIWGTPSRKLTLDLSGAVMYYDRNFPAGGRRYNGMLEIGPSLQILRSSGPQLTIGAHWMHISNGSGLTPRNPSYEGIALSLRYRR